MTRHNKSEGIVLVKKNILKDDRLVIIFTKDQGKMVFSARGVRTLMSRRSPHLETGNYIKFNYSSLNNFSHIGETELIYGYSKIKTNKQKLDNLFLILFVLNKILPEDLSEIKVFDLTLEILKKLNNKEIENGKLDEYLCEVLSLLGYLGPEQTDNQTFDVYQYLNDQFNIKISKYLNI
jgi:DNA repair protein RecO